MVFCPLFSENFRETVVSANRITLGERLIAVRGALREVSNVIRFCRVARC